MTSAQFVTYYRRSLAELGLLLDDADAMVEAPLLEMPASLRAWYEIAGHSQLNAAHNRILGPEALRVADDKIIFAEENQDAVVWGFDISSTAEDPEVWQGQAAETEDHFDWYSEETPLSRFLMAMLSQTIAPG